MPTPKKVATVAELSESLRRAQLTIVTDYRGLKVSDMQSLRSQLRPLNAEVKVAKNTLTRMAARQIHLEALDPALEGPTALVVAYDDPVQPAKVVSDFARTSRILQIRAGLLQGALIRPEEVEALASLPSREVLVGRVIGGLAGPLYGLAGVLSGPIRSFMYVIQARLEQLGGAESAESEAA
jgi:large subunit ribosomal protein L10